MRISKNKLFLLFFMVFETFLLKTYMYDWLPDKYFFDSGHILGIMNGTALSDKSYLFVASIFKFLNIFKLTNIKQWGWFISIFFVPLIVKIFIGKNKIYNFSQCIFVMCSFTLLNIYVLGISKDIIQFVFFFFIYLILLKNELSNTKKIISICLIFLIEAIFFRIYYAIMAIIFVTIYLIYLKYMYKKKINGKEFIKIILFSLLLFFAEIYFVSLFSYNSYDAILNARYSVNITRINDPYSNTIINELLGQNINYFVFMGNYIINFFRLLFPIELITKGYKQILFMLYQFYISFSFIRKFKYINKNNCLLLFTLLSFILVSVIFEPDFGSFVRHETSAIVIILEIIMIRKEDINEKD